MVSYCEGDSGAFNFGMSNTFYQDLNIQDATVLFKSPLLGLKFYRDAINIMNVLEIFVREIQMI
jgi:hypothetical protein